jgi:hypothetical protein
MSERSDMPIASAVPSPEESPKSSGPENRAQVRFPFTAAAEICELHSQARLAGRCSDLSSGGCYIDTISPFPVGTVVRVRLERDPRGFEAKAVVAYAHVTMGMGLAFTEIQSEHQDVLRSWIAELSGEPAEAPAISTAAAEPEAIEADANLRLVLHELITLLVRKKIITENEATGMLREMFR